MNANQSLAVLIGAPRSGTTWLQSMLGRHPRIASPQETDLFTRYIAPLEQAWQWQVRGDETDWIARRLKGLPSLLSSTEFRQLTGSFIEAMMDATLALKPGADIVLEKSPSHSLEVHTIGTYVPSARVLHIVRDGRDVVESLLAASHGWGAFWAPRTVSEGAAMWADYVEGARTAANGSSYHELRYETLRDDGVAELRSAFSAVGVEVNDQQCKQYLNADLIDQSNNNELDRSESILIGGEFHHLRGHPEPAGFIRSGQGGGWRSWNHSQRIAFDEAAGELLIRLGYEPDRTWSTVPTMPKYARKLRKVAARAFRGGGARIARRIDPKN